MATSIINTLEGYYTLTYTGAQVQTLLDYMRSFSAADVEEMIANSFVGLDSSTTSTNAYIIAETNEGNEVTTAIPPATTTNAGVMTAADKIKLNGLHAHDGETIKLNVDGKIKVNTSGIVDDETTYIANGKIKVAIDDETIVVGYDGIKINQSKVATHANNGLMSKEDKIKLDAIAAQLGI